MFRGMAKGLTLGSIAWSVQNFNQPVYHRFGQRRAIQRCYLARIGPDDPPKGGGGVEAVPVVGIGREARKVGETGCDAVKQRGFEQPRVIRRKAGDGRAVHAQGKDPGLVARTIPVLGDPVDHFQLRIREVTGEKGNLLYTKLGKAAKGEGHRASISIAAGIMTVQGNPPWSPPVP